LKQFDQSEIIPLIAACPAKQERTGSRLWRIQSDKIKVYARFRYQLAFDAAMVIKTPFLKL